MNTETLSNYFNSSNLDEEAMELIEMHGFLTSLCIVPGDLSDADLLNEIFASKTHPAEISTAISAMKAEISQALLNGEFPELPATSELSEDEELDQLTFWAAGFMQGVFLHDTLWFNEESDDVAELTLPILSCSGLLDEEDEGELLEITDSEEILDAMAEKIPDCIVDLYLLFNAPANA